MVSLGRYLCRVVIFIILHASTRVVTFWPLDKLIRQIGMKDDAAVVDLTGSKVVVESLTETKIMCTAESKVSKSQVWQWSLSTRDKLGTGPYDGASLQGTSWGWVLCPLYSGASLQGTSWEQVHTVEPLYKGQVGTGPLSLIQWSLSTRDKIRGSYDCLMLYFAVLPGVTECVPLLLPVAVSWQDGGVCKHHQMSP